MKKNIIIGLIAIVILSGCTDSTEPSFELLSPKTTVEHSYVTLEIDAQNIQNMSVVNNTLATDQNRTIIIKGVKNDNLFYFYNVPLQKGENDINITASNVYNTITELININSDANGSAPIGMRASEYEGIKSLQTNVEVGTLLNVEEYLFDSDGDGIIDETSTDGNFSVNYTNEGRYKPRVTIRTVDDVLYSSNNFALSLDVKADENQIDPKGAEPIDVAKKFVKALIDNDRNTIEILSANNSNLLEFIYKDDQVRQIAVQRAKLIDSNSWKQTYHPSGASTVNAMIDDPQDGRYSIGFELTPIYKDDVYIGKFWYVNTFY